MSDGLTEMDREEKLERYRLALEGIASCATACQCCRMHAGVAEKALGRKVCLSLSAQALIDRQCTDCEE